jgi:formylglycine-generating enzyme required for sulfatase activity
MGASGYLHDNADVTAPVNSYAPNALGIYNLNGNVAEMTSEALACGGSWSSPGYDVRNESTVSLEGATPTIGFRPVLTFSPKN